MFCAADIVRYFTLSALKYMQVWLLLITPAIVLSSHRFNIINNNYQIQDKALHDIKTLYLNTHSTYTQYIIL